MIENPFLFWRVGAPATTLAFALGGTLEQLCDLPWFRPPQPLVRLPRQSIHFGAQGNQILDLLAEVVDLRTQQAADMTAGCAAPVTHGQNDLQFGERKTNRQSPLNQFHPLRRC